jgi:serine/threonine protein kinase
LQVIGKGSYGKVMLVKKRDDGSIFAMKVLIKQNLIQRGQVEHTRTERHVLEVANHPFIVKLHYAFQNRRKLFLVMEYCPGYRLALCFPEK